MDYSMPGLPVLHHLLEFARTHVRWVCDAIQPSHPLSPPSSPALDLSQHLHFFQWVGSLHQVAKVLELQLKHQSFQWIFRTDFLGWLFGSPCSPGILRSLLQHHSLKASVFRHSAFSIIQLSHLYMTIRKTIALTMWAFVGKVLSLLFNMLSRFVIAFLPWSKCLLISWLQSPSAVILEPKKIKSVTVSIVFPCIFHEVMGPDAMIFVFWLLSFKPAFSLSFFTLIKRLFSSSLLSVIRVVSSGYLGWLIFLQVILIPACDSSSPAFCMMYFTYKLNKQGDIIQPWWIPFPICNQSVVPCLVLLLLNLHTGFSGDR